MEDFVSGGETSRNGAELDGNLELIDVVRKHIHEVADLYLALGLVVRAGLRLANVRVVLIEHDFVVDAVLEGIGEETTVAAPRRMITVKDLLGGQLDCLARLEEDIALDGIDSGVRPG